MAKTLSALRRDARAIFRAGVEAADPRRILSSSVSLRRNILKVGNRQYPLSQYRRIFVGGAGKASAAMAANLEKILGARITAGRINVKYGHGATLRHIAIQEAGHPLPDENGFQGAREIVKMLSELTEQDLVIFLISGGGSALMPYPIPGISLEEKQQVTNLLLRSGATIQEINTIRKHLSFLKGGGLAKRVFPATLITLILSDVIGDPLDAIASGPTVPDSTTFQDCAELLDRYALWDKIPPAIAQHFQEGREGRREETLKKGDRSFQNVFNRVVGNNFLSIKAAKREAKRRGYRPLILSSLIEGETREVAKVHTAIAKEVLLSGNPIPPPACILSGGETTVTLAGNGKGGRNQEFVLAAAMDIAGAKDMGSLSAGTDGTDGPTDAAGAIADGRTIDRALKQGMKPRAFLQDNNSYPFFAALKDLVMTGPTGTNVMDLRIILVQEPASVKKG